MKNAFIMFFMLFTLLSATAPAPALAAAPSAPKDGTWEPVQGGPMIAQGESIPASRLVGAAYGFIWVMLAVYLLAVWSKTLRLERDIDELRGRIDGAGAARRGGK